MHPASVTVIARGDSSQTPAPSSPPHANTSFITFLIALLILVFASGALVLRAGLIRRRYRRRAQEAIHAGILPNPPSVQHKPELYEIRVRAAGDAMDWQTLMPICASKLTMSQNTQLDTTCKPNMLNPPVRGRLKLLGRGSTPAPSANDTTYDGLETLQVVVLIAMPSEYSSIRSLDSTPPPCPSEGERSNNVNEDALPDVMLGVSTFAVLFDEADS